MKIRIENGDTRLDNFKAKPLDIVMALPLNHSFCNFFPGPIESESLFFSAFFYWYMKIALPINSGEGNVSKCTICTFLRWISTGTNNTGNYSWKS